MVGDEPHGSGRRAVQAEGAARAKALGGWACLRDRSPGSIEPSEQGGEKGQMVLGLGSPCKIWLYLSEGKATKELGMQKQRGLAGILAWSFPLLCWERAVGGATGDQEDILLSERTAVGSTWEQWTRWGKIRRESQLNFLMRWKACV